VTPSQLRTDPENRSLFRFRFAVPYSIPAIARADRA